jgi:tetratricopeptide (TPR) repeat protein
MVRRVFLTALLVYIAYLWPIPSSMTMRLVYPAKSLSEGHLSVEEFGSRAYDVAVIGSHEYSVAAPLDAVAGAPLVLGLRALRVVSSAPGPWATSDEVKALVPFTLLVAALAGALAAALLARALLALGAPEDEALAGSLVFAFATPLFPYATVAYQTASAMALIVLGAGALVRAARSPDARAFFVAGLGLGLAVLADYHAIWVALPLALATLASSPRGAPGLAAGAAGPALLLLAYHASITGNPFDTPASHWVQAGEAHGRFPFGAPSPWKLYHLLLGPWKGLLRYWPVLGLGILGLARLARSDSAARPVARALLATAAIVVLANASMNPAGVGWSSGGESFGPRYSLYAVPLLAFGLGAGLRGVPPRVAWVLVAVSFATAWAGAQASWQLGLQEHVLELFQLGPRLRAATILTAVFAPGRDAELAGVVAALVAFPLLGALLVRIWRPANARRAWTIVLALSLLHALLAIPYFALGRGEEDAFRKRAGHRSLLHAAELTSSGPRLIVLAQELLYLGEADDALRLVDRALELDPKNPQVLSGAIRMLRERGHHARGRALGMQLARIEPRDVEVAVLAAEELGESERARELWRAILAARPDVGERLYLRPRLVALGLR